jgi:hypothetical protein
MNEPEWTEGVLGDGAAILRDGVQIPISELLHILNSADSAAEHARIQAFEEAAKIAEASAAKDRARAEHFAPVLTPDDEAVYEDFAATAEAIAYAIRQHAKGEGK